jgi:hypothetical protein
MDVGRPRMAKAVERKRVQESAVHRSPSKTDRAWSRATKDALIRHFGSLKAAAISMGNYDASQLSRDLDGGKFRAERLDLLTAEDHASISTAVADALANRDPKARVRRLIREGRRILDELAEAVAQ